MKKDFWSLSKFIDNYINKWSKLEEQKEEVELVKKRLNEFAKFDMTKGMASISYINTNTPYHHFSSR